MPPLASIDIGSHTARLLVTEGGDGSSLTPLLRRRVYTRAAAGLIPTGNGGTRLSEEAVGRILDALEDFKDCAEKSRVGEIYAVATGVLRGASNRGAFVRRIRERTGIETRILSGDEEARLTAMGALHALNLSRDACIVFDLGGGSTEFFWEGPEGPRTLSLPLGAALLTRRYPGCERPGEKAVHSLRRHVRRILHQAFDPGDFGRVPAQKRRIVGTGGTAATLAALERGVDVADIRPERLNGTELELPAVERWLAEMKRMSPAEREALKGVDRGRADVLPAGIAVLLEIHHVFRSSGMTVSLSDLLEGCLLEAIWTGARPGPAGGGAKAAAPGAPLGGGERGVGHRGVP